MDSIYYFDPTADRKRDETDTHFNRYFAFAKNRVEMLEEFGYADLTFGEADEFTYLEIIKQLQENDSKKCLPYGETKYINNMSSFINKRPMDIDINRFTYATETVKENPNIASEVIQCNWYLLPFQNPKALVKAISVVRKLRYYEDSEKYPYSSETMSTIAQNSQWNRPYRYYTNSVNRILSENSERYDKEAKEIDLVKVLRKINEQKIN